MHAHVTTRNEADPDKAEHMVIDDTITFHREWLIKHIAWALRAGRSVTVYVTDEPVTFEDRRPPQETPAEPPFTAPQKRWVYKD